MPDVVTLRHPLQVVPLQISVTQSLVGGGFAGLITGFVVGPCETWKVIIQETRLRGESPWSIQPRATMIAIRQFVPVFALLFSVVCAIEFSANKLVKDAFGLLPGTAASACTGGAILATADHIMLVKAKEKLGTFEAMRRCSRRPATGFCPMFMREGLFVLSVLDFGPAMGRLLRDRTTVTGFSDETYTAMGRWSVLIGLTVASQPFDCLAREMQNAYHETQKRPKLAECARTLFLQRRAFVGVVPRVALAPVGGTMIGSLYDAACTFMATK